MKLFEPITIIIGLAALYWVIADVIKPEPEPTCTLSTEVSDTETVYQVRSDVICEEMRKNAG